MKIKHQIKRVYTIANKSFLILLIALLLSSCTSKDKDNSKEQASPDTSVGTGNETKTPDTTDGLGDEKKPDTTDGNADEAKPEDANFNEEADVIKDGNFLAYLNGIDPVTKTLTVDDIEWIPATDPDRLKEIGVNPDDVLEYHIYNPIEENITYNYSDTLKVELVDEVNTVEKTVEDLVNELTANKILCHVTIADSEVVQITEQYTP